MLTQYRAVMIMWMEGGHDGASFNTLGWNSGRGTTRTYRRDHYDGRLSIGNSEPLPYFDDAREASQFMWKNMGMPGLCQVDLAVAHELDFPPHEFDPDDIAHHGMRALKTKLAYV